MKLIDLLSVCGDAITVNVYDTDYENVGVYNGKDSIPEEYNEQEVLYITSSKASELDVLITA